MAEEQAGAEVDVGYGAAFGDVGAVMLPLGDEDQIVPLERVRPLLDLKLAAAGITKGCNPPDNDLFCPGRQVTRGEMASMLVRALGITDSGESDLFVDDDHSIFEKEIDQLASAGIARGCNPPANDMYCPEESVTRGQMAAFLRRSAATISHP